MKFKEIEENSKVFPGEYLLHTPSRQIVLCGAFKKQEGKIKALINGRLLEDEISNFQKIYLNKDESRRRTPRGGCGGCKKQ
tara:strand:+ start:128 stop:370 length:243 start_codon:yes stop_codon:yes gene_type:complete